jgi:glycosyltransferase involved in cell wall biosynthesis
MISVIIPVYNTVEYLTECVQSIQQQTFREVQILLVDDGSTDGSGELCDNLAKMDSRIVVHHQPNGGPVAACNAGLAEAKGEFVTFLDSDDYLIDPKAYETAAESLYRQNADAVQFQYEMRNMPRTHVQPKQKMTLAPRFWEGSEIEQELMVPLFIDINNAIWCPARGTKIYRTELVRAAASEVDANCHYGEDALFQLYLLAQCQKVGNLPAVLGYGYRYRADSLCHAQSVNETLENIERLLAGLKKSVQKIHYSQNTDQMLEQARINKYVAVFMMFTHMPQLTVREVWKWNRELCRKAPQNAFWREWQKVNPAPSRIGKLTFWLLFHNCILLGSIMQHITAVLKEQQR